MLRLRFSFIPRGEQITWKCDIIERLDIRDEGWFIPFECYHSIKPLTSPITKTLINDNISEYTVRGKHGYTIMDTAIEDTKEFTKSIKQFVEEWKNGCKQESYEITI